jgi:hypothetical protein
MVASGYTIFFQGDYMGLTGPQREVVVPPLFDVVEEPSGGMVCVQLNGQFGYYDLAGNLAIPLQAAYARYGAFQGGLAKVQAHNGLWGFIDLNGHEVIRAQFRDAESFSDGLAVVAHVNGGWGAIDALGQTAIACQYPLLQPFCEGYAVFGDQQLQGLLNKLGEVVLPQRFFYVGEVADGQAVVKLEENGVFKEGVFQVQEGTITWNDGLDAMNSLQAAMKQWVGQVRLKLDACYQAGGCACTYPRLRQYVAWQGPATFRDQEALFQVWQSFLEQPTENTWLCPVCQTTYQAHWVEYGLDVWALHVDVQTQANLQDTGPQPDTPVPYHLGFRGYQLNFLPGYQQVAMPELVSYLFNNP